MVLGVISGRLSPDSSLCGPGQLSGYQPAHVVSHIVGLDGWRMEDGGGGERYKDNVGAWIQALVFPVLL